MTGARDPVLFLSQKCPDTVSLLGKLTCFHELAVPVGPVDSE